MLLEKEILGVDNCINRLVKRTQTFKKKKAWPLSVYYFSILQLHKCLENINVKFVD